MSQVNFLPVGHKHEDIDALFGVFCSKLKSANAFVPEKLASLFLEAQRRSNAALPPD